MSVSVSVLYIYIYIYIKRKGMKNIYVYWIRFDGLFVCLFYFMPMCFDFKRSANHMKFTEEYLMCTEKNVLIKKSLQMG